MRKVLSFFIAFLMVSGIALAQKGPGTLPDENYGSRTGVGLQKVFSITGKYTLSADGAGSIDPVYNVLVNKPTGGVVNRAFLMMTNVAGVNFPGLVLNGTPVVWDLSVPNNLLLSAAPGFNHFADVTPIVSGLINAAPAGLIPVLVEELNSPVQDGVALMVIFEDPAADDKTILILFGSIQEGENLFNITLAEPLNPGSPDALADMGVGISFSEQTTQQQYSLISAYGTAPANRISSYAGGEDDADLIPGIDGRLITVGGIGDSHLNPPDPMLTPPLTGGDPFYDDELYNLLPFFPGPLDFILLFVNNPSYDDNLFTLYLEISGEAFIGESIILTQTVNARPVNTNHTVVATLTDDGGGPVVNREVFFEVISGPNAGKTGSGFTNGSGQVPFTYLGDGGPGFDRIEACFVDNLAITQCSNVLTIRWFEPTIPVADWALYIGIFLILAFAVIRMRRLF